jgi:hypothetical protein
MSGTTGIVDSSTIVSIITRKKETGTSSIPAINLVFVSDSGKYPVPLLAPFRNNSGQDAGTCELKTFFLVFFINIDPMMK